MKIFDQKRDARQDAGVDKWLRNGAMGTLEWFPGVGKTSAGIKVSKKATKKNKDVVIHIVVPSEYLQSQWQKRLNYEHVRAEVFIINTYIREPRFCDLLIVDEVHTCISEHAVVFRQVFNVHTGKWILGLSGTIYAEEKELLHSLGIPVVDIITEAEALREGFVAKVHQYNVGIEFTEEEQAAYKEADERFTHNYNYFLLGPDDLYPNFDTAMACISNTNAAYIHAERKGWNSDLGDNHEYSPKNIRKYANLWNKAMHTRRILLNNALNKELFVYDVVRKHPGAKTIIFSESTSIVDRVYNTLCKLYGYEKCVLYHSKLNTQIRVGDRTVGYVLTDKKGKMVPDSFTDAETGEIHNLAWFKIKYGSYAVKVSKEKVVNNAIERISNPDSGVLYVCTAKSLDVGADVQDLKVAVVLSGNSGTRQNNQRKGRTGRKEGIKEGIYYSLFVKGTQDAKWLESRQKTTNPKPRYINSLDEVEEDGTTKSQNRNFNFAYKGKS